jgi:hypothetical protein
MKIVPLDVFSTSQDETESASFICNHISSANLRMRHLKYAHIHSMSLLWTGSNVYITHMFQRSCTTFPVARIPAWFSSLILFI